MRKSDQVPSDVVMLNSSEPKHIMKNKERGFFKQRAKRSSVKDMFSS